MSRIRNAWRALMGAEPSQPCSSCEEEGALFGLNPPAGCTFRVKCHRGSSWFVYIERGGKEITSALELIGDRWNPRKSDEELIVMAAKSALKDYAEIHSRAGLEGVYPPKRAKGAK